MYHWSPSIRMAIKSSSTSKLVSRNASTRAEGSMIAGAGAAAAAALSETLEPTAAAKGSGSSSAAAAGSAIGAAVNVDAGMADAKIGVVTDGLAASMTPGFWVAGSSAMGAVSIGVEVTAATIGFDKVDTFIGFVVNALVNADDGAANLDPACVFNGADGLTATADEAAAIDLAIGRAIGTYGVDTCDTTSERECISGTYVD